MREGNPVLTMLLYPSNTFKRMISYNRFVLVDAVLWEGTWLAKTEWVDRVWRKALPRHSRNRPWESSPGPSSCQGRLGKAVQRPERGTAPCGCIPDAVDVLCGWSGLPDPLDEWHGGCSEGRHGSEKHPAGEAAAATELPSEWCYCVKSFNNNKVFVKCRILSMETILSTITDACKCTHRCMCACTCTHTQVFYGDDCRICDARSPPDFADWLKITCVSSLLWWWLQHLWCQIFPLIFQIGWK